MSDTVKEMFSQLQEIERLLITTGELSLHQTMADVSRRVMVVAAASNLEHEMKRVVRAHVHRVAGAGSCVAKMVEDRIIERAYHQWFTFKEGNAGTIGPFIGMMGEAFRAAWKRYDDARDIERGFIRLGTLRNTLVHNDYSTFDVNFTANDIMVLYLTAALFPARVEAVFNALPEPQPIVS